MSSEARTEFIRFLAHGGPSPEQNRLPLPLHTLCPLLRFSAIMNRISDVRGLLFPSTDGSSSPWHRVRSLTDAEKWYVDEDDIVFSCARNPYGGKRAEPVNAEIVSLLISAGERSNDKQIPTVAVIGNREQKIQSKVTSQAN